MSNNNGTLSKNKKLFLRNDTLVYSLISVILGLIVGAIVLAIAGFNPIEAYIAMIDGIFGKPKYMAWTIIKSTPLILTGLSVAFAFRTGLFNIGAEGQYIIGALAAGVVGYTVSLPL
ncbi:MAG TPA: ABC transporter permease, partial [Peptostreptococcaceae bacterium]|nr:ABC transporter permease [Peptostreptococcaceae bacterium]